MTVSGFDGVDKHAKPEKSLTEVLKKKSGRNSYGRIPTAKRLPLLLRKLFSSRTFLFFVFRPAAFSAVIFIRQSAYSQMTSRMNSVNPENSFSVAMRPWLMSTNSCGQASVPLR